MDGRHGRTWTDVDGRDGRGRKGRTGRTGRTWTDGKDADGRDGADQLLFSSQLFNSELLFCCASLAEFAGNSVGATTLMGGGVSDGISTKFCHCCHPFRGLPHRLYVAYPPLGMAALTEFSGNSVRDATPHGGGSPDRISREFCQKGTKKK